MAGQTAGQALFASMVAAKHRREDQSEEIDKLRCLLAAARDKLAVYHAQHSGEYVGGMEYSELVRQIDVALRS
jgi:hypothetical protein